MIYQLSSPLQADLETPTLIPSSIAEEPVVYKRMFSSQQWGGWSKNASGRGVGHVSAASTGCLLSSALIRDGEMLLQQSETESQVTPGRVGW